MGKLLMGRFGQEPDAESVDISLRECHQKLGLKPSDFVSQDTPSFFRHSRGAKGKYLVFEVDKKEIADAAAWKPGYYLMPIEAADVLRTFNKDYSPELHGDKRPVTIVYKDEPPQDILDRARRWADASQPLFFQGRNAEDKNRQHGFYKGKAVLCVRYTFHLEFRYHKLPND